MTAPVYSVPLGHVLGVKSRLVTTTDQGHHIDVVDDSAMSKADPELEVPHERIASWVDGMGWVVSRRSMPSIRTFAYRALHTKGLVRYRGLRGAMDTAVWEPA